MTKQNEATKVTKADEDGKESYPYIPQDNESQLQMKMIMAFISAGVPIGFVSNPGLGKTATIQSIADTMGRELINLSLSTLPSEDVAGIPSVVRQKVGEDDTEVARTEYAMPGWQLRILKNPNSILFLDEMSTALPSTQHAFLQIIQDRRFPGSPVPFSKKVGIIVAMNPAGQAGGSALDPPIANRFGWFAFKMPYEAWLDGFIMDWKSDKPMKVPTVETDPKKLASNDKRFRLAVKDYLQHDGSHQTNLMPDPADDTSNIDPNAADSESEAEISQMAFMTNRSWDNLARVAKYFKPNDYGAIQMAAKGLIGAKNSIRFSSYYKTNAKFDIEAIMKDPKGYDWDRMGIDDSTNLFRSLLKYAEEGYLDKALDVYFAIWDSGHRELVSGSQINDIWKGNYLSSVKDPDFDAVKYREEYLKRFKGLLKSSVR